MSSENATVAEQEYLEIMFWLEEAGLPMTGANIARAMQLSPPTVHEMVGRLIDDVPFKPLQLWMSVAQIPLLIFAAHTQDWWLFAALLVVMVFIFGSIPFTDAMIVRYVDDRLRSRVAGMRLTVSFGISSLAVWILVPMVKGIGFSSALWIMAGIAAIKAATVLLLPEEPAAENLNPP